jgi:GT2 family glycosyltransferase
VNLNPAPSVLISVLNWNTAEATAHCVNSLLELDNNADAQVSIVVLDNGSAVDDWNLLRTRLGDKKVELIRNEENAGFAGGHNIVIQQALARDFDFVWLVNSDAVVAAPTLDKLLPAILKAPEVGAVSPVIRSLQDASVIAFCGAWHDWANMASVAARTVDEAAAMEAAHPADMWLMGAAVLLRVSALREVGLLEERYFAYYEDNDVCARLSAKGWLSKMVPEAEVLHSHPVSRIDEKPPYYFYLMARNGYYFWHTHTPKQYRSLIRLKLIDRAVLVANRLRHRGQLEKAEACLLGVYDSQTGRTGKWRLSRSVPFIMNMITQLRIRNHSQHFRPGDA